MKTILSILFLALFSLTHAFEDNLDVLISTQEIDAKMKEAAKMINNDYKDKNLTVIMIMKGAVCVAADLIRNINVPFKLDYIKASSYGNNGTVSGNLKIEGLDRLDIEGRDVLLVDDIFETGKTITGIKEMLQQKKPNSIKTFVLLLKNISRKTSYQPDYVLFTIPNRFVVGYGLDYKEFFRGLPDIRAFKNDTPPF